MTERLVTHFVGDDCPGGHRGELPDDPGQWCGRCDRKLSIEDGDEGLCRDCQRELGGSD